MLQAEGILAKETHDNVIRFAPPLVIDKTEQGFKEVVLEAVHFVPLKSGIA